MVVQLPIAISMLARLRRTNYFAVGSTQSLKRTPFARHRACSQVPARSARGHRACRRRHMMRAQTRSVLPGGRDGVGMAGLRPDAPPRWRPPSICCCRSAPGGSRRPTPAPRGSLRTGRHSEQLRPLGLEHVRDCLLGQLRMAIRLGVGDALSSSQAFSSSRLLNPQPRRAEALAHQGAWFSTCPSPSRTPVCAATGWTRCRYTRRKRRLKRRTFRRTSTPRRSHVVLDPALAGARRRKRPVVGVNTISCVSPG